MLRVRALLTVSLISSLAGCGSQSSSNADAARASLRDADANYGKVGTAKNKEAFMALYTADAVAYPPGEATVSGSTGISTFIDAIFKDPAFVGRFDPAIVDVSADGTMGTTLAHAEVTTTGPDGKPVTERLRDFHVWRRQPDGSWKITVDIWNAEAAPATAAAKD
jgi:uncharacterized protein (TIGR02246 family)